MLLLFIAHVVGRFRQWTTLTRLSQFMIGKSVPLLNLDYVGNFLYGTISYVSARTYYRQ